MIWIPSVDQEIPLQSPCQSLYRSAMYWSWGQLTDLVKQQAPKITFTEQADFQIIHSHPAEVADPDIRVEIIAYRTTTAIPALAPAAGNVTHNGISTLTMQFPYDADDKAMNVTASSAASRSPETERILRAFEQIFHRVSAGSRTSKLSAVLSISPEDMCDIWKWNSEPLPVTNSSVLDLIDKHVRRYPDSQAVCSWDGALTYKELDEHSCELAHHLMEKLDIGSNAVPKIAIMYPSTSINQCGWLSQCLQY